jgi:hypothetical protein
VLAPSDFVPSITSKTSASPINQVPAILKTSRIHIPFAGEDGLWLACPLHLARRFF